MRTRAVALSVAAIAAGLIAGGHDVAAGPRRPGRLVRVPRPPLDVTTAARVCSVYEESTATCALPVTSGEVGLAIDDDANVGAATIRLVEPQVDSCGMPSTWKISFELQGGGSIDAPHNGLFVLDFPLNERARPLPPDASPRDGEQVDQVIDSDGDGDGDLRVTHYSCTVKGALDATSRPSFRCTDTWIAVRDRWQRARSDRSPVCDR